MHIFFISKLQLESLFIFSVDRLKNNIVSSSQKRN